MAIQDDGKIIAAGQTYVGTRYFTLVRYSEDGHIDSTFGINGIVKTNIGPSNDYLNSIDIDKSTGKIIVAGYSQKYDGTNDFFATVKYLKNGVIDSSFVINGILVNKIGTFGAQATTIKIQNNSNILVGGSSSLGATLLMLKPNGKIDSTFGKDGIFGYLHRGTYTSVNSILIDQNDRIIIAANYSSTAIIMRLLSDGAFDNSWSADGREKLNLSGARSRRNGIHKK
ncbi:MAG: hypothetical protein IPP06_00060 [Saprospiraceae bacterium]|nr:hypothetical protein [Candidatus Vicinibacter affinis]